MPLHGCTHGKLLRKGLRHVAPGTVTHLAQHPLICPPSPTHSAAPKAKKDGSGDGAAPTQPAPKPRAPKAVTAPKAAGAPKAPAGPKAAPAPKLPRARNAFMIFAEEWRPKMKGESRDGAAARATWPFLPLIRVLGYSGHLGSDTPPSPSPRGRPPLLQRMALLVHDLVHAAHPRTLAYWLLPIA
jgi:hypothetical protein